MEPQEVLAVDAVESGGIGKRQTDGQELAVIQGATADSSRLRAGGNREEEVGTCPFLYDAYTVRIGVTSWTFAPAEFGFTHGWYCSLKWGNGPSAINFRFNDTRHEPCTCPTARYCDENWGIIDQDELGPIGKLLGSDVLVGRCAVYDWVLVAPMIFAFLSALCCGCLAARRRRFKQNYVVVIRNEPVEYVRLD
jgi:hypothetical protein